METTTDIIKRNAIITFVEPHITGGESIVTISAERAIKYQSSKYCYNSQEGALEDFINVNWCTVLPPKTG